MDVKYYCSDDGRDQRGPLTLEALRKVDLKPTTLVWYDGLAEWMPAQVLPELVDLFQQTSARAPGPTSAAPIVTMQYAPPDPKSRINAFAVTSLVLGILSVPMFFTFILTIPTGFLAIVFGHISRVQIKRGHGTGKKMALAGLILGYAMFGLTVLVIGAIVLSGLDSR